MKLMSSFWKMLAHWKGDCECQYKLHQLLQHTYPVESLAGRAVTVFGGQRFLSAQLILDFPAVALGFPHCFEVGVVLLNFIRRSKLPLILLAVCGVSCLVLMLAIIPLLISVVFT